MRIRNSAEIAALNEGSTISRPPLYTKWNLRNTAKSDISKDVENLLDDTVLIDMSMIDVHSYKLQF